MFHGWFVELCDKTNLLSVEQRWLDIGFDKQKRCYNISPEAGRHPQLDRMKTHTVISPNNEVITFTGIRQFCRENTIRFSGFCGMLNGKHACYSGWRLPHNAHKLIGTTKPKAFNVKLQDPNGNVYGPIFNLEVFCQQHSLQASSIRHLLAGRYKTSKGWKVVDGVTILDKR